VAADAAPSRLPTADLAVLLPTIGRLRTSPALANGILSRWLSRADHLPIDNTGSEALWRSVFTWPGRCLPTAALTRAFDAGDALNAKWLRADPAHVRADMSTARMLACGEVGLSIEETRAIARDLKPLFGDAGLLFDAPRPNRWYLRALSVTDWPTAADPDDVLGDDLKLHLPAGAAGKRWRMLFNEAQMILHQHAVNAARAARGAVSVNSLWFWGGGSLPVAVASPYRALLTEQPALTTLAHLAGIRVAPATPSALAELADRASTEPAAIIDLAHLRDVALESDWLEPIDRALRRGHVRDVVLAFASGERAHVRSRDRWRFWRPLRGLGS